MKAVAERAWCDWLRITVVVERDGPSKALSITSCALRVAMWFAVSVSGFNNVSVTKVDSPLNLIGSRFVVH
jgi:hypothetical protein